MKDAFGVEISKAVPDGLKQIRRGYTLARVGNRTKPMRVKQAQSGIKQAQTPENATRMWKDKRNSQTSAMNRDLNEWHKSGFKGSPFKGKTKP